MRIIAVVNQKGGTGKTTTTQNLGVALAKKNKKVLLIDLDAQANLTYSFGIINPEMSVTDALRGIHALHAMRVNREGVDIIPASALLSSLEISIINKPGREGLLKDRLKDVTGYDYVLLDCPPALSVLTINALTAADQVITPMQMEILSLQGLTQLLETIKSIKQEFNHHLQISGIVAVNYDTRRRLSEEVLGEIEKKLGQKVYKAKIRPCVRIAEAPSFAQSVMSYAPSSNGALDYEDLAKEIIKERN